MPLALAEHVPVGQHAGLGPAGRPGGEQQHRRRERLDVDDLLERVGQGQAGVRDFAVPYGFGWRTVVHQHQGERRQVLRGHPEHTDKSAVHDHGATPRQRQLVGQKPTDKCGVERHAHRPEVGERERADHLLGAVAHQQPDGCALLDSQLAKPARHTANSVGGLVVGQLALGSTQERFVRGLGAVPQQQLDDPRRLSRRHRHPRSRPQPKPGRSG